MRMIDADALKLGIIYQSNDGRESYSTELVCEFIDQQPTVGWWIPAEQPPNVFDEHDQSEDVIVKLEWYDKDITYSIGWYSGKYGWSDDERSVNVIAWMPLPWMKLSDLYQPEGESHE